MMSHPCPQRFQSSDRIEEMFSKYQNFKENGTGYLKGKDERDATECDTDSAFEVIYNIRREIKQIVTSRE
jgi:hypothetical protein